MINYSRYAVYYSPRTYVMTGSLYHFAAFTNVHSPPPTNLFSISMSSEVLVL